jgi:hypothetical protein
MEQSYSPAYTAKRERFGKSFTTYQAVHPDEPLTLQVCRWLAGIPVPTRRNARVHLKALLKGQGARDGEETPGRR